MIHEVSKALATFSRDSLSGILARSLASPTVRQGTLCVPPPWQRLRKPVLETALGFRTCR